MAEQGTLPFDVGAAAAAPPAPKHPPPTKAEKEAQRARQKYMCATCGGVSKGMRALDVIRLPNGKLMAYCRKHRLEADAPERCRKGAAKRRRPVRATKRRPGQRRLQGVG